MPQHIRTKQRRRPRFTVDLLERIAQSSKLVILILTCLILGIILTGCDLYSNPEEGEISPDSPPTPTLPITATPIEDSTSIFEITFRVYVPEPALEDQTIYLSILDEVTGLGLNARRYPMQSTQANNPELNTVYEITLPFLANSSIIYRYERESDSILVGEHLTDGRPVRYRIYQVFSPGVVEDQISQWTDTQYSGPTGQIIGKATDMSTGEGIASLLISAGGVQTFTASDGSFTIQGLPPGTHNLVGYSIDGKYQTFQQGARTAEGTTTLTPIALMPTQLVKVTFNVTLPANTPPAVPVRMAGNLYQLGNSFSDLLGGMSVVPGNMPTLIPGEAGQYTLTIELPAGADIRYKYTLGDGFWNAEHAQDEIFPVRQLIVPDKDVIIKDTVDTWFTGNSGTITFDVKVPLNTPQEDLIFIQFAPLFGWTEPIPIWRLGEDRWAYILFSPVNLPGNISYRYCRNGQCGIADDVATPGIYGAGRPITTEELPLIIEDTIEAWVGLEPIPEIPLGQAVITPRGDLFFAGIGYSMQYHPSWKALNSLSLNQVANTTANGLVISPTWTVRYDSPTFEQTAGNSMLWPDILALSQQALTRNLVLALKPTLLFPQEDQKCDTSPCPSSEQKWWLSASREPFWWENWFKQYRIYLLHHAELASIAGAEILIIGGNEVLPALPNGILSDGSPSSVPEDSQAQWESMIADIRSRFTGSIYWAIKPEYPFSTPDVHLPILQSVDGIYLEFQINTAGTPAATTIIDQVVGLPPPEIAAYLDNIIFPIQQQTGKPVFLSFSYPADPDSSVQSNSYLSMLDLVNSRSWISGFVSSEYYPPVTIQDQSASIHGKQAENIIRLWYSTWLQNPAQ